MTKIEAIAYLEKAMKNNPKYAKKWRGYIELIVIDTLTEGKISVKYEQLITKEIASNMLDLFQADWWEAQEKSPETGAKS